MTTHPSPIIMKTNDCYLAKLSSGVAILAFSVGLQAQDAAAPAAPVTPPPGALAPASPADLNAVKDAAKPAPAADNKGATTVDGKKPPAMSEKNDKDFQQALDAASRVASVIEGKVISLNDAMRMTLMRQPSIQLAQEDLAQARAALLASKAPFDYNVTAHAEIGQSYSPMPDVQIHAQREAKANLQAMLKEVKLTKEGKGDGKVEIKETNRISGKTKTRTIDISNINSSGIEIAGLPPSGPSPNDIQTAEILAEQADILDALANTSQSQMLASSSSSYLKGLQNQQRDTLNLLDDTITDVLEKFKVATTSRGTQMKYSLGAGKLYRNGIFISPHIDFNRQAADNNASINLDFNIPLMQGRGAIAQRAQEDSSLIDLDASKWQYRHNISSALLGTIVAYWNCVAAQQEYALARGSEEIARTFSELSDLRVENNDLSAGEAAQAQARYAEAIANRFAAEFRVLDARSQLALAVGMESAELTEAPYAYGALPEPMSLQELQRFNVATAVQRAILLRDDQRSALQLARSGKILAEAARFDLKPRVDLFVNTTAAALDRGTHWDQTFSAFSDRKTALGVFGGVDMAWPVENSAARSNYESSLSTYRQRSISAADLQRFISSGVILSVGESRSTRLQFDASQRSADYSRKALEAERAKFNEGETTLLDSIQLETQYTQALLRVVLLRKAHAIALSRVRFETGTLLEPPAGDPTSVVFSAAAIEALPNFDGYPDTTVPPVPTTFDRKPVPLLNKLGVVKNKEQATPAPAATGKEVIVTPVTVTTGAAAPVASEPVVVKTAPASVPAASPAPAPAKPTPPPAQPAERKKPKPLLERLSGE